MKLKVIPTFLLFLIGSLVVDGILGQQQVLSVHPQMLGLGGGEQPIFTTYPSMTGLRQQQPSLLQVIRQQPYGLTTGGLTQVVGQPGVGQLINNGGGLTQLLGQPGVGQLINNGGGLTQLLGQPGVGQLINNGGGIGVSQPFVMSPNTLGLAGTSTLPYPYSVGGLTTANINGVPVIIASSPSALAGLGLTGINMNGLQTVPLQTLQQPVVSMNPVLRDVAEEEELDPMDAALLNLENKGQMHMEKYAWGRSGLRNPTPTGGNSAVSSDGTKEQRSANVPIYYNTLPTVSAGVVASSPSTRVRTPSNPFVDGAGKRKKHFELYQYYRNMDLNSPRMLVPVGSGMM